ncbi:MAG: alpha-isopropylmalate synthase regulatory domain-containing protein [Bradymonadaceae bacterium]
MPQKQEKMISLMKEILQDDYVHLKVESYAMRENLEEGVCNIECKLRNGDGSLMEVAGEGVGLIDALFNALRAQLAGDFPSLKSIRFSQFNIRGLLSDAEGADMTTKAEAEATVGIQNSEGREFIFLTKEPSVSRAGIQATVEATEYFVNSERTYVKIHEILEHYRKEGRTDLVEKYTDLMSRVVENTSYSEVVERIRSSLK